MAKTYNKKEDFIKKISGMSHEEINNFIKTNGKPPKKVMLAWRVSQK